MSLTIPQPPRPIFVDQLVYLRLVIRLFCTPTKQLLYVCGITQCLLKKHPNILPVLMKYSYFTLIHSQIRTLSFLQHSAHDVKSQDMTTWVERERLRTILLHPAPETVTRPYCLLRDTCGAEIIGFYTVSKWNFFPQLSRNVHLRDLNILRQVLSMLTKEFVSTLYLNSSPNAYMQR